MSYLGFFEELFWQSLVSELFATFIGALLGILTALWLERQIERSRYTKESKIRKKIFQEEKKRILEYLKIEISNNIDLLNQIKNELNSNSIIYYNLDISAWNSLESKKAELIDDLDIQIKIHQLYFEYQHIIRKVDLHLQGSYNIFAIFGDYAQILRDNLVNSILSHIRPTIKKSKELIEIIENDFKKNFS